MKEGLWGKESPLRAKRKTAECPYSYFSDEMTGALQGGVACSVLVKLGLGFHTVGIFLVPLSCPDVRAGVGGNRV